VLIADALIERATKTRLADVARLLAPNIGWYHQRRRGANGERQVTLCPLSLDHVRSGWRRCLGPMV
jgi:hypothetical protein